MENSSSGISGIGVGLSGRVESPPGLETIIRLLPGVDASNVCRLPPDHQKYKFLGSEKRTFRIRPRNHVHEKIANCAQNPSRYTGYWGEPSADCRSGGSPAVARTIHIEMCEHCAGTVYNRVADSATISPTSTVQNTRWPSQLLEKYGLCANRSPPTHWSQARCSSSPVHLLTD